MARESKEQREADRSRGHLSSALGGALIAQYRLGYKHGYEDAKKSVPSVISQRKDSPITVTQEKGA
jgi:hypothetical protein